MDAERSKFFAEENRKIEDAKIARLMSSLARGFCVTYTNFREPFPGVWLLDGRVIEVANLVNSEPSVLLKLL